jgi:hypothetical protein
MIISVIVLSLLLIISFFVIYNLLKKVEKYEEDIVMKDEYLNKLKEMSQQSYVRMTELDNLQAFESDDEVGFFFKNLKDMVMTIDTYMKNYTK